MQFNIEDHPHRRYNPLTNDWILVSQHRDITSEQAAPHLRDLPEIHYKKNQ